MSCQISQFKNKILFLLIIIILRRSSSKFGEKHLKNNYGQ